MAAALTDPDLLPWAFHDLPLEAFPFVMRAFRTDDGAEVWAETVPGPYVVVEVPALARLHGVPVRIEVHWPDGSVDRGAP